MSLRGYEQANRELATLREQVRKAQRAGEKKVADIIAAEARQAAPGSLSSGITVSQTQESTIIDAGSELAAYAEYGTGDHAAAYLSTQPPEVVEEARKFFVSGKGRTPPKPFITPAVMRHVNDIVPAVEAELQKIGK